MRAALLLVLLLPFSFVSSIFATIYTCDPTVSCGCSVASTVVTSRIVGGEAASNNAWGWMVSLREDGSHICGASLLTSEYAVTAAHCVADALNNPSVLSIVAGTNYLNDTSSTTIQQRTVQKIISHPDYNSDLHTNDIALLQFLPLIISSSSKLAVICLPNANQDSFQTNSNLVAIGWGVTLENSYILSNYLQQVTVQAFSSTSPDCIQAHLVDSNVQFCAGISTGGKDTCQGDSGGPLMAFVNSRWVLAGLTSYGYGCAKPGFPGVYTRVSAFISFIDSTANISETLTTTSNSTQLNSKGNCGSIIDKLLLVFIFSFSLVVLLSISFS